MPQINFPVFIAVKHHVRRELNQIFSLNKMGRHHLPGTSHDHRGLYMEMSRSGVIHVDVVHQGLALEVDGVQRATHNNYLLRAFSSRECAEACMREWGCVEVTQATI